MNENTQINRTNPQEWLTVKSAALNGRVIIKNLSNASTIRDIMPAIPVSKMNPLK